MDNFYQAASGGVSRMQLFNYLQTHYNLSEQEAEAYINNFKFNNAPKSIDYNYFYNILNDFVHTTNNFKIHNSKSTQLYVLENFLSVTDCCTLIEAIRATARPSTVADRHDKGVRSKIRTSRTADLSYLHNEYLFSLDRKICGTLGLPMNLGETLQAQMYEPGEFYKAHFDFFRPDQRLYKTYTQWMGQRTWTFMVYLNDVQIGGETKFPLLNLKFKPKQGRAIIWNNLNKYGKPNLKTLHEALPPVSGNKYVLTKWFRSWPLVNESPPLVTEFYPSFKLN